MDIFSLRVPPFPKCFTLDRVTLRLMPVSPEHAPSRHLRWTVSGDKNRLPGSAGVCRVWSMSEQP
ncbi:hypothetical protein [Acetobacter sp.]|uniref:hypothetical protein n=1 Tax=Acetobacter sp. TaxID=440 RepID=UPI0025BA027F|nr:hypothetical protein [Acetobacter sp.]MCH4092319.1 hypothetical protein [Acetobacter sp.]MCI1301004.1 hypothetical protein [Acetobacter sp.]MCI1317224.1 hypothetical protein [Acetobacter sp.]